MWGGLARWSTKAEIGHRRFDGVWDIGLVHSDDFAYVRVFVVDDGCGQDVMGEIVDSCTGHDFRSFGAIGRLRLTSGHTIQIELERVGGGCDYLLLADEILECGWS